MSATLYGAKPACSTNTLPTWHNASEWDGAAPVCNGEWRRFAAPADTSPALKRRSESKYSPDMTEATVRGQCGQTVGFTGWVLPRLGAAGSEDRHWHCLAQLHGPNYGGVYAYAAVALMVREGSWWLEFGHPDVPAASDVELAPYVDGASVYVDMKVTLGETAATGRVFGTLGAVTFDVAVGTFYHQFVVWSHGLYRGSGLTEFADGGPQPTYYQENNWKLLGMTKTWPL